MMELHIREMTPQEQHYCYSQGTQIEDKNDYIWRIAQINIYFYKNNGLV